MTRFCGVAFALMAGGTALEAADWLNLGGDARQTNVQALERELSPASVGNLKLIWKRKLGGEAARLSSPVIMGRLITYRGTVELVFVASSDGDVWAVDGDFGTVFWTRHLDSGVARCPAPATPGLTPNPPDADPDDDGPQPVRPLYVLGPDGMLHGLDPIDGKDLAAVRRVGCAVGLVVKEGKAELIKSAPREGAVVAGGVAFVVSKSMGELSALDAVTRKLLYRSVGMGFAASALAVANGHVCFTASDGTLYCYGFPVDR